MYSAYRRSKQLAVTPPERNDISKEAEDKKQIEERAKPEPIVDSQTDDKCQYTVSDDLWAHIVDDARLPVYFTTAIRKLYESSCDNSGQINKDRFMELFRGKELLTDDLKNFLLALFRAYDRNEDGSMDIKELVHMLDVILCGDKKEKIAGLFRMFDRDGSKTIDRDELQALMLTLLTLKDEKDVRSESDRRQALIQSADIIFETFDSDGDGIITSTEFMNGCLHNEHFLAEITQLLSVCVGNDL